jgi:hypothetical protein
MGDNTTIYNQFISLYNSYAIDYSSKISPLSEDKKSALIIFCQTNYNKFKTEIATLTPGQFIVSVLHVYNLIVLHLCTFKTPTKWAVMSEQGDADCAFEMRNGVKVSAFSALEFTALMTGGPKMLEDVIVKCPTTGGSDTCEITRGVIQNDYNNINRCASSISGDGLMSQLRALLQKGGRRKKTRRVFRKNRKNNNKKNKKSVKRRR